ncbi:zinc-binding alcohol dehydrogenase family protein [Sphingomonas piscis]|uniref:Zinc-binding alcohol dehydrogenase family protein n=1 Tax=Sphingomonas piscis TaxID=2714943 RepID=A0A6G7YS76_9SPHN|nr:zinc-binding alcohol dehydrogenase family protein [Sphingomonas piscis]QIK79593.1 zinc-binding alcohol dehydrogenase family protein [Sphingomonas piscis]
MKALLCNQPQELDLIERSVPAIGEDEALVRIRRVGLCGTDYHIFGGRHPFVNYPLVIGHELSGEVAEVGEGSRFKVGQPVAINPYLNCGHCIACRRGKPNACVNIRVLGVHTDGGMCELLAVPDSALIDAAGLTLDQAAMLEFLSIGAHAVARSPLRAGDKVLVMGAGPIGVASALFAQLDGGVVTLVDTRAARLDYARDKLGFTNVVVADDSLAATLAERTAGDMFDVVFDATGNLTAMGRSVLHVAHGGSLVLVGVAPGDLIFADPEFHKREMTLVASRNALAADFDRVADAIRSGQIPTDALHTHSLTLDEVPQGLPDLIDRADHVLKAITTV